MRLSSIILKPYFNSPSNGLPQGSVLTPLLFYLYILDLPNTKSRKFCYADNIALACREKGLKEIKTILIEDLATLSTYFKKWRLKPCLNKTEVCAFHLNNKQAHMELFVQLNLP